MIEVPDGCVVLEPRMVMDVAIVRLQPDQDGRPIVVYSRERIIRALMAADRMDREEAEEFFDYNIASSWYGPRSPKFTR